MFAALGAHAWAYPMLEVVHLLANRVFTAKMVLIMLAGCNAGWFHARRSLQRQDRTARLLMLLSSALWLLVLTCGRWIGYV